MKVDVPAVSADILTRESRKSLLSIAHAMRKKSMATSMSGRLCVVSQRRVKNDERNGVEVCIFAIKGKDPSSPIAVMYFKRRSLFSLFSAPDVHVAAFVRPLSALSINDIRKSGDTLSGRSGLRRKLLPAIDQWHNMIGDAHEMICSVR